MSTIIPGKRYLDEIEAHSTMADKLAVAQRINTLHPIGTLCSIRTPSGELLTRHITRGVMETAVQGASKWTLRLQDYGVANLADVEFENTTCAVSEATHGQMVRALCKSGEEIKASLTPENADLWHVASCIPAEAGELFDAIKKHVIYGKPLDRGNVVEELGDLEFYMARVRQILGITRQETLDDNVRKLSARYPKGTYTNEHAQARLDKAA